MSFDMKRRILNSHIKRVCTFQGYKKLLHKEGQQKQTLAQQEKERPNYEEMLLALWYLTIVLHLQLVIKCARNYDKKEPKTTTMRCVKLQS